MFLRHARVAVSLALLLTAVATAASADVLWDQSAITLNQSAPGIVNSQLNGFGGGPYYSMNDVTVPAGGWTISVISEWFSDMTFANMQTKAPTGYLIVMPKTGTLPVGTPTTTTISLTWTHTTVGLNAAYIMTTPDLGLNLAPGDYWITVSPIQQIDNFNGNNLQWPALNLVGAPVATYGGSTWSNLYGNYDAAFRIEGIAGGATPTAATTWGQLKALYR